MIPLFYFSGLSCEIFYVYLLLFNLCHSCPCGTKHECWLHSGLGAAGGIEEPEHGWGHRGTKAPRGMLEGVRREREMRMACVAVTELLSPGRDS